MGSVRVAIVGVGNCAASLVQGVEYYRDADPARPRARPHARDVRRLPRPRRRVRRRVRRRRQEGRLRPRPRRSSPARTTPSRSPTSPPTGVTVQRGHTLDGLGKYYRETIEESDAEPGRRRPGAQGRQGRRARLLPAGRLRGAPTSSTRSARSTRASPSSTRCRSSSPPTPSGPTKFEDAGVPIVGDDIKTQVGATITHRVMAKLFEDRGVVLDRTYQLNVGGNMDFKNMLERDRLESKKISKTQAVTSNLGSRPRRRQNVHIGPSDYVAVARRPQVGLRPPRGPRVRRRPAEPGVQARGLGLPQLGRHHHRRHPRGEDRQGPRHRRRAALRVVVLHEVPARAARGRPRAAPSSRPSSRAPKSADERADRSLPARERGTSRMGGAPFHVPCLGARDRSTAESRGCVRRLRQAGAGWPGAAVSGVVAFAFGALAGPRVNNGRTSTSERSRRQKSAFARRSARAAVAARK